MSLNAASEGNFKTRSPEEAKKLNENLISSNCTKNADLKRMKWVENRDGEQIDEVKAKLDSVHNLLVNKKQVYFAAEMGTAKLIEEKDVKYINEAGVQSNSQRL